MERTKYPRTFNLSWSGSESSDDVWLKDESIFDGLEVVVTEKVDGECSSIYSDGYVHARSPDTSHHPSRSWIKQHAATFAYQLPDRWRVCGENLFAAHSIWYWDLPTYFFVFAIFDEEDTCLGWDDTVAVCSLLGLTTVPVVYRGIFDAKAIRSAWTGVGAFPTFETPKDHVFDPSPSPTIAEGYVVRTVDRFPRDQFKTSFGKFVRKGHVTTSQHWMEMPVLPNRLRESS